MARAFTLIELLVVIAILSILAAVALPNFLEAQVRARVARTHSDLRTVATAMETYRVDNTDYPEPLERLSSPVAYLGDAYTQDVFANPKGWFALGYVQADVASGKKFLEDWGVKNPTDVERAALKTHGYFVFSNGPDRLDEALESPNTAFRDVIGAPGAELAYFYDATNGTTSRGDILRTGRYQPK